MKFEDLSIRAQNVITAGCGILRIDPDAFFDSLRAEMSGSEKYFSGWQEIAEALGMMHGRSAYHKAQRDPVLSVIIVKRGGRVLASRVDIESYLKLNSKTWKKSAE